MNQYPLWKYLVIFTVIGVCALYAMPNLFGEDPAVQIAAQYAREDVIDETLQTRVENYLKDAGYAYTSVERTNRQLLVRFSDTNTQLQANTLLREKLDQYNVAPNLAPATPDWLLALGAQPMYLGLDLRGGVHFLMQIDMETAIAQDEENLVNELRALFRENKLRYRGINRIGEAGSGVRVNFTDPELRSDAIRLVEGEYQDVQIMPRDIAETYGFDLVFTEASLQERRQSALTQNIDTLRNRVNELGVAEPIIQRQGSDRIVVQLPGVQDTARAKEVLGATATLEFRMTEGDFSQWREAESSGRAPLNARLYYNREGEPVLLKRSVIVTGDQIINAAATIDQRTARPATTVTLDSKGARRMLKNTRENVGRAMGVVFIEYKIETKEIDGKRVTTREKTEEVINVATIQEEFSKRFQITGLTSNEATNLALLLRAGALKAPMEIIEERTIGPSLGKENIEMGMLSILLGFISVMVFMGLRYKTFGLIANLALMMNIVILVALLSLLQATLTLPGMAGIVLTLGMAVDANVLIFERIREELANGNTPQASIHAGYEKAFATIADSNITTLIAAIVLFGFGTGPIKGFAITLSLGIISSMFTAILFSRGIVNYLYGGKRLTQLPI